MKKIKSSKQRAKRTYKRAKRPKKKFQFTLYHMFIFLFCFIIFMFGTYHVPDLILIPLIPFFILNISGFYLLNFFGIPILLFCLPWINVEKHFVALHRSIIFMQIICILSFFIPIELLAPHRWSGLPILTMFFSIKLSALSLGYLLKFHRNQNIRKNLKKRYFKNIFIAILILFIHTLLIINFYKGNDIESPSAYDQWKAYASFFLERNETLQIFWLVVYPHISFLF